VRLFAGDRIYRILDRLGPIDSEGVEQPLEQGLLTRQIENAQKKVEERNFLQRKRVLEYDDVMNQQREIIYELRDRILEGEDMSETARTQIADAVARMTEEYLVGDYVEDWDVDALLTQLEQMYPVAIAGEDLDPNALERQGLIDDLREDVVKAYDEREEELGAQLMRELERFILLQIIDDRWREHLHDMDYLREGIHLRSFAQDDPLVAYKNEGFRMFTDLINAIWEEFARYIFNVEVQIEGGNGQGAQAPAQTWQSTPNSSSTGPLSYHGGRPEDQPSALQAAAAAAAAGGGAELAMDAGGEPEPAPAVVETRRVSEQEQIGRNDPCWCGSGKKFKKCHGA
jgi:preprotein translocase subunit SecA